MAGVSQVCISVDTEINREFIAAAHQVVSAARTVLRYDGHITCVIVYTEDESARQLLKKAWHMLVQPYFYWDGPQRYSTYDIQASWAPELNEGEPYPLLDYSRSERPTLAVPAPSFEEVGKALAKAMGPATISITNGQGVTTHVWKEWKSGDQS